MKIRIVFGSLLSATLIILVSFLSLVGCHLVQATDPGASSPLFVVRTQQATGHTPTAGVSAFVGKGAALNLFELPRGKQGALIQTALQFFKAHPAVLTKLLENIYHYPYLAGLLEKQGVSMKDIEVSLQMLQHNPDVVVDACLAASESDPAQPLGLSTSNPLGCVIVAIFVMVPVVVTLTLLLLFFTLRILTCINFNNCANDLAQSIWDQMIQGLTQPGVTG